MKLNLRDDVARLPPGYLRVATLPGAGWCHLTLALSDGPVGRRPRVVVRQPRQVYGPAFALQSQWHTELLSSSRRASHAGLVPLWVADQHQGQLFAVQPWVPGESLEALVGKRQAGLPERAAAAVVLRVAEAVAALHAASLVHGALHLGHVLLTRAGEVHVLEPGKHRLFALRRRVHPEGRAGEDALSRSIADPAGGEPTVSSDVYALGLLLLRLVQGLDLSPPALDHGLSAVLKAMLDPTGHRLPDAATAARLLRAHLHDVPPLDLLVARLEADLGGAPSREREERARDRDQ